VWMDCRTEMEERLPCGDDDDDDEDGTVVVAEHHVLEGDDRTSLP